MTSAVLDTNILASGTVSAINPPGQILNAWRDGKFLLITSEHIITELEHVFQKPYFQKYLANDQIQAFTDLLRNEALVIPITVKVHGVATHPEDDLTISTALSAHADYLVTGDQHLLHKVGKDYKDIKILTPKEFLPKLDLL